MNATTTGTRTTRHHPSPLASSGKKLLSVYSTHFSAVHNRTREIHNRTQLIQWTHTVCVLCTKKTQNFTVHTQNTPVCIIKTQLYTPVFRIQSECVLFKVHRQNVYCPWVQFAVPVVVSFGRSIKDIIQPLSVLFDQYCTQRCTNVPGKGHWVPGYRYR